MDDLDAFILKTPLIDRWQASEIHEVQRDQPNRCRTYLASNPSGQRGFIKVLPPSTEDLRMMQLHLEEFFAEKAIVELCAERKMRRIVRALAFGNVTVPGIISVTLHYLVFEWADHDMRSLVTDTDEAQLQAALACMHHMATALQELHLSKIAHQNLRPAAVLRFEDATHKLGDFRHALQAGVPRTEATNFPDATHAPPELLYGKKIESFDDRYAVDMYQLGALGLSLLTGVGATAQLSRQLTGLHHWRNWQGSFADVLPHLAHAHEHMMHTLRNQLPESVRVDLGTAIHQLTDPDPARRGHPTNVIGAGSRYGLERYISLFDVLRSRVVLRGRGAA
jgi:serine/threonine protein kinase